MADLKNAQAGERSSRVLLVVVRPPADGWPSSRSTWLRAFACHFSSVAGGTEALAQPVDDAAREQQVHLTWRQIMPQRDCARVVRRGGEIFAPISALVDAGQLDHVADLSRS